MPTYEYEHEGEAACPRGARFLERQSMRDDALTTCPECGAPVFRVVHGSYVSAPRSDSDLRDKGFAKLVRRDNGVYENVTALDHESKIWDANKPETMPDIGSRISD